MKKNNGKIRTSSIRHIYIGHTPILNYLTTEQISALKEQIDDVKENNKVDNEPNEIWECRTCGVNAPCRVEITQDKTKLPDYLKRSDKKEHFRDKPCICKARLFPDWKRIDIPIIPQEKGDEIMSNDKPMNACLCEACNKSKTGAPAMVPLDPSITIPNDYEVKCVAFATPGDIILTMVEGKMIAAVYNSSSLFPCIILQKKRWRALATHQYYYIKSTPKGFEVAQSTERGIPEDHDRFNNHNYFASIDEAKVILFELENCWNKATSPKK